MKDIVLYSAFYIVLALAITFGSSFLESDFLFQYLEKHLVTILIAFLGVSVATISIVATKLKEIIDKYGANISSTIKSLRFSIKEQIFYILFAVVVSILYKSALIMGLHSHSKEIIEVAFVYIFLASLHNIYDTANAIFIIFEWEAK